MMIKLSNAACFPSDARLYVTAEVSSKPVCGCHTNLHVSAFNGIGLCPFSFTAVNKLCLFFLSSILTPIGENREFHWLIKSKYKHNDNYQVHLITSISVILIVF